MLELVTCVRATCREVKNDGSFTLRGCSHAGGTGSAGRATRSLKLGPVTCTLPDVIRSLGWSSTVSVG